MQVSFNPNITNYNQKYQPAFKAVIPEYVNEAKRQMKVIKCVNSRILLELLDNVILFKKVSKQDAIDTLEAIKKFAPNVKVTIEHYLDVLKNS